MRQPSMGHLLNWEILFNLWLGIEIHGRELYNWSWSIPLIPSTIINKLKLKLKKVENFWKSKKVLPLVFKSNSTMLRFCVGSSNSLKPLKDSFFLYEFQKTKEICCHWCDLVKKGRCYLCPCLFPCSCPFIEPIVSSPQLDRFMVVVIVLWSSWNLEEVQRISNFPFVGKTISWFFITC